MELVLLGLVKVLDNVISTAKSITTYKNKKLLTSILVVISQFLFYFVVKSIVQDSSTITTIVVCICSGIGTYVAMLISEKTARDVTYMNILTCDCNDSTDALCDYLLEHKIKYIPVDSYDRQNKSTRTVMAFAANKYESSLIDNFLKNSDTKYLRQVLH